MLDSIQVSFRVVGRHLRTNNEFKLRVLIYRKVFRRGSLETTEGNAEKGIHGGHLWTVGPFTIDLRTVLLIRRVRLRGFQYLIFEDSKYGATEGIDGP
ncbi:hypothetical protein MTR67_007477 [Solanum verrucosum]|uniref:Uncharacterized protein n=1 Tax=Solanum verrucosum TaxID=315347 RepID=A0AAF0TAM9_SOLVR|nr:hypothetical protein MTR67_007477 [Solanum verrucosum]